MKLERILSIGRKIVSLGLIGGVLAFSPACSNQTPKKPETKPYTEQKIPAQQEPVTEKKETKNVEQSYKQTRIAFVSAREDTNNDGKINIDDLEIYIMNPDGSKLERLTNNSVFDVFPIWSPDGKRIAFMSGFEIYTMNADGSNQKRLTNNTAYDAIPAWSPNGKQIAFTSDRDGNEEIYIMNVDGTNQINLTNNSARDNNPSWSPDGKRIAFLSVRDGSHQIYIMNVDGSKQENLTKSSVAKYYSMTEFDGKTLFSKLRKDEFTGWSRALGYYKFDDGKQSLQLDYGGVFTWSPDGKEIAFISERNRNYEINFINSDGNNQKVKISDTDIVNINYLRWSPDGKRISYSDMGNIYIWGEPGHYWDVMDKKWHSIGNVYYNTKLAYIKGNYNSEVSWSPDGKQIAFTSDRDGNREIYIVNADGLHLKKLTNNTAYDGEPSWSPFLKNK